MGKDIVHFLGGGLISNAFDALGGGKSPKVSGASSSDILGELKKSRLAKTQLLATEGGIAGQELTPDQVGGRTTIFGN